jgi:hypothetical protein
MSGFVGVVLGGAGIAADFVGVPGLGAGVGLLQQINTTCEKVSMHKVRESPYKSVDAWFPVLLTTLRTSAVS